MNLCLIDLIMIFFLLKFFDQFFARAASLKNEQIILYIFLSNKSELINKYIIEIYESIKSLNLYCLYSIFITFVRRFLNNYRFIFNKLISSLNID